MMTFSLIALVIGLFFIVIIIALAVLVIWAIRRTTGSAQSSASGGMASAHTPKEVLQMRYARGEITREQYQQMLQDLDLTE
jgi:putative membrane protein